MDRHQLVRDLEPIFIVGVGRSGTSLLQSMLHAHPDITFLPETHFFRRYVAKRLTRHWYETLGPKRFRSVLNKDDYFKRGAIPANDLLEPYLEGGRDFSLVDCYARLLQRELVRRGTAVVGDKDPRNIDHIESLHEFFPNSSLVHIVRDPRDVLYSRLKAKWSSGRPYWINVFTYDVQMRQGCVFGNACYGDRYLEIRYEDLISMPEEALGRICRHLGLAYSPDMLAFASAARELVHSSEMDWKKNTIGPLLKDNRDKWRGKLSLSQIKLTEYLCADWMRRFHYLSSQTEIGSAGPSANLSDRLRHCAFRLVNKVFSFLYESGRRLG